MVASLGVPIFRDFTVYHYCYLRRYGEKTGPDQVRSIPNTTAETGFL